MVQRHPQPPLPPIPAPELPTTLLQQSCRRLRLRSNWAAGVVWFNHRFLQSQLPSSQPHFFSSLAGGFGSGQTGLLKKCWFNTHRIRLSTSSRASNHFFSSPAGGFGSGQTWLLKKWLLHHLLTTVTCSLFFSGWQSRALARLIDGLLGLFDRF